MSEKRRFSRWDSGDEKAYIDVAGTREEVEILDISIGGMRVTTSVAIGKNKEITGEFKILPNIGSFFVKGKVVWVIKKEKSFESGIEFDKVSTIPINLPA